MPEEKNIVISDEEAMDEAWGSTMPYEWVPDLENIYASSLGEEDNSWRKDWSE